MSNSDQAQLDSAVTTTQSAVEIAPTHRKAEESGFSCRDGTRLFYRYWSPQLTTDRSPRALIYLHRGHEHSGRVQRLLEALSEPQDWAFAWDARGHGYSPGERGDAPDFKTLVCDFDAFVAHICCTFQITHAQIALVANSVGAVIAATWLHDYAPRIRGVVMAAAAFEINLYVPLALPALRLACKFKADLFVTSYIRPGMLTHCAAEATAYARDPLITKNISARVLIDLADTAKRIVEHAHNIDTPTLLLVAEQDFVVKTAPQQRFFLGLNSALKRLQVLKNARHAIFYEQESVLQEALQSAKTFLQECFAQPLNSRTHYLQADRSSHSARQLLALQQDQLGSSFQRAFYSLQRTLLGSLGQLSHGMRIGSRTGFDSGASLDYVYRNVASGALWIGKFIDRGYLDAIGWRGIRLRKQHLQSALAQLIAQHTEHAGSSSTLSILDVAAGGGRYLLETAKRFQAQKLQITLRDLEQKNLDQARALAAELALQHEIDYQCQDAFAQSSDTRRYDIAIVSGLYELFSENAPVLKSLLLIAAQLKPGGVLIYTGQPWHPQLLLIAKTLRDHRGLAWQMRPRAQTELDGLVQCAGFRKLSTQIGLEGIFTVSVARLSAGQDHQDRPEVPFSRA
jgi:alpha-beta hydrolase superfamily lysophospholipase/SAM-dependent methyltransferase